MSLGVNKVSNIVSNAVQNGKKLISEASADNSIKPRKITDLDRFNFRTYIHSKNFDFKTTPEELKELFKFENDEFFVKVYEFLIAKLGIPQKLKPQILDMSLNETVRMAYDFTNNTIIRNSNHPIADKNTVFGLIRHELQHLIQNLNILRTEGVGEQAVELYPKIVAKQRVGYADYEVKNLTLEQLKVNYDEETLKYYQELKNLFNNNPQAYEAELKNLSKVIEESTVEQYRNFRDLVVKEMGLIKADTKPAKRSKKMLDELLIENGYYKKDGNIHAGQYIFDIKENDALTAQDVAMSKLVPPEQKWCYMQRIKQQIEEIDKVAEKDPNNQALTEIVDTAQQKLKKSNIKELISYLYD